MINKPKLSLALRQMSEKVRAKEDPKTGFCTSFDSDVSEMLCVLARMVQGVEMERAFGAPGDWVYDTPIGDALAGRASK
jgi:hypothetical protein